MFALLDLKTKHLKEDKKTRELKGIRDQTWGKQEAQLKKDVSDVDDDDDEVEDDSLLMAPEKPPPFLLYACMLPVFLLNRILVLVNQYNVASLTVYCEDAIAKILPKSLRFLSADVAALANYLVVPIRVGVGAATTYKYHDCVHPIYEHMFSSVVAPALYAAIHGDESVYAQVFARLDARARHLLCSKYKGAKIEMAPDDIYFCLGGGGGEGGTNKYPLGGVNGSAYALVSDATNNMEHAMTWFRTVLSYVTTEIPRRRECEWDSFATFNKFCFERSEGECMGRIRDTPGPEVLVAPDENLRMHRDSREYLGVVGRFVTNIVRLYVIKLNSLGLVHNWNMKEDEYAELVVRTNPPVILSPPSESRPIYLHALSSSMLDLVVYEYSMIRNRIRRKQGDYFNLKQEENEAEEKKTVTLMKDHVIRAFFPQFINKNQDEIVVSLGDVRTFIKAFVATVEDREREEDLS